MFLPSLTVNVATNNVAAAWTAFVGGTIFEVGSYLMILEALNRKHVVPFTQLILVNWKKVCFGDAVKGVFECTHLFHTRRGSSCAASAEEGNGDEKGKEKQQWIWFGTRWHELGFVACAIQLVGATVFWISTITGIPNVINMENIGLVDGIYWVPQVIGGSGFIISRFSPPFLSFWQWVLTGKQFDVYV